MSRFRFIAAEQASHAVAVMCRVLGVSRSGYDAWRNRPASARASADSALSATISQIQATSRGLSGAPRIHAELAQTHRVSCGGKRVARLMRTAGLVGCHRRRTSKTTRRDDPVPPAPDLVGRRFIADAPDVLWVADITYLPTGQGFGYLAVVLAVCTRRAVGWAMADHRKSELGVSALEMARGRRDPGAGLVHHSDRGSQYPSVAFGQRCHKAGIIPSLGSIGDCYDNARAESFFATRECELIAKSRGKTMAEARMAVFEYSEVFYNARRRHSALGYLSPSDFERRCQPQAVTER